MLHLIACKVNRTVHVIFFVLYTLFSDLYGLFHTRIFYISLTKIADYTHLQPLTMKNLMTIFIIMTLTGQVPGKLACYRQMGINEGLTQSTVGTILRDRKGMLWIGTEGGLNLYDCSEIIPIHHNPEDPHSLPSDRIYTLREDKKGDIWVGTYSGLAVLHPSGFQCETLTDGPVHTSLHHEGKLFFGGVGIFYAYDMDTGFFTSVRVPSEKYLYLSEDDRDHILIGTMDGTIFRYHITTGEISDAGKAPFDNIYAMFRTAAGDLYVSSYKDGIYQLDKDLNVSEHWTSRNSGLSHDIVNHFMEKDGFLYCATDGGGICVMDTGTGKFPVTYNKSDKSGSIPTNSINTLYEDCSGNIWAGTVRNGILCLRNSSIRTFGNVPENFSGECSGLSEKNIASLFEDVDRTLWIGTDGNGLNSYNPRNDSFRHYISTRGMSICSITDFDSQKLLVTTFNLGTYLFDKRNGVITRFIICDAQTDESIRKATSLAKAHRITEEKILIFGNGIITYDTSKGTFRKLGDNNLKNPILACADSSGAYLITNHGSDEIFRLDKTTDRVTLFKKLDSGECIKSVAIGSNGQFYIGTETGLTIYDPITDSTFRYKTDLFTSVKYITTDSSDRLWIAADNSLFTYSNGDITSWGESDGFKPNEISNTFQHKPQGAEMYLGGTEGLVKIETDHIIIEDETQTISLREASVDGENIHPENRKIKIPSDYRVFKISVCSDESDVFRVKKYRYTIKKSDMVSSVIYGSNLLTLPVLSDGTYSITAACLKRNGRWTENFYLTSITILRPWYRSTVASILYLMAVALAVGSIIIRDRHKIAELKKGKYKQEEHALYCNNYSLLIIDSSQESNQHLKNELSHCFKNIYSALNAEKALTLAREKKTDIILAENHLPGISGAELCRRIKEDSTICNATVIIMTQESESKKVSEVYREGADYFIYKPFDIDLLINISYNSLKNKERIRKEYRRTSELMTKKESGNNLSDEQFSIELERLILENLTDPKLNVDFLMKRMHYGRTTFYARVKAVTGMSVTDFINMTRISRAKHIICTTQLTLSEIAFRVGCSSLSRFSIMFKHYTGMTPSEYKKTI